MRLGALLTQLAALNEVHGPNALVELSVDDEPVELQAVAVDEASAGKVHLVG